ncbi:MAG: cytochrome bc complex cytochrome b subunit, partial [Alphaproteobacteria bacterium]
GLYYGSYKAPREVIWILGCLIFLLMMATAFLGYTLPWGQMSFWGATVITNLFSAIPLVGKALQTWLWGGFSVDQPTLNRFFSLHYLLPFVIAGVVVLHIWALHVPGNNNPLGINVKGPQDTVPFHPYYTTKDGFAIAVFLVVYMGFVFFEPEFFGSPDNSIRANPMVTPTHIVPEWYLLPFYAILRSIDFNIGPIDSKLGGVLAMFGAILMLFLLPWLDTSPVCSGRFRPLFQPFFWLLVLVCLGLGWVGAVTPDHPLFKVGTNWEGVATEVSDYADKAGKVELVKTLKAKGTHVREKDVKAVATETGLTDEELAKIVVSHPDNFEAVDLGRLLTLYYFLFFLVILPVVGLIETPKRLPENISEPVLPKGGAVAAGAAQAPAR